MAVESLLFFASAQFLLITLFSRPRARKIKKKIKKKIKERLEEFFAIAETFDLQAS
jgi:hypothetical protein